MKSVSQYSIFFWRISIHVLSKRWLLWNKRCLTGISRTFRPINHTNLSTTIMDNSLGTLCIFKVFPACFNKLPIFFTQYLLLPPLKTSFSWWTTAIAMLTIVIVPSVPRTFDHDCRLLRTESNPQFNNQSLLTKHINTTKHVLCCCNSSSLLKCYGVGEGSGAPNDNIFL